MGGGALGAGPYAHARGENAVVHAFCLCHCVQLVHLLSPGQLPRQSRAWVCGCVGVCTRVSGWHMEGGGASHLVEHRAQPIVQLPEARGQLLVRRGLRRRHEQTQKAEAVPAFVVATYLSFSSEDIEDIFAFYKTSTRTAPILCSEPWPSPSARRSRSGCAR